MEQKECHVCGETKQADQFDPTQHRRGWCMDCQSARLRRCYACNEVKPFAEFYNKGDSRYPERLSSKCIKCHVDAAQVNYRENREQRLARGRERRKDPAVLRRENESKLRNCFGIGVDQYEDVLKSQHGVCAICQQPCKSGRRLAVDHDRSCCPRDRSCGKCVRGLLCMNCNNGIGRFEDDVELLYAAIAYLGKWRSDGHDSFERAAVRCR